MISRIDLVVLLLVVADMVFAGRLTELEQPDGSALLVHVDGLVRRGPAEPRHPLHVAAQHDDEARPALGTRPRTGRRHPVGRFSSVGSWLSDRCVLAMQTGIVPNPSWSIRARSFSAAGWKSTPSAPYTFVAIASTWSRIEVPSGVSWWKSFGRSQAPTTASASSTAPSPPSANPRFTTTVSAPAPTASSRISSTSASVSLGKLLTATTHGTPYAFTIAMCCWRFSTPRFTASRSSVPSSSNGTPPWDFVARTVVTSTPADGAKPPNRHTMSQNFWKPRSLANPASVTT